MTASHPQAITVSINPQTLMLPSECLSKGRMGGARKDKKNFESSCVQQCGCSNAHPQTMNQNHAQRHEYTQSQSHPITQNHTQSHPSTRANQEHIKAEQEGKKDRMVGSEPEQGWRPVRTREEKHVCQRGSRVQPPPPLQRIHEGHNARNRTSRCLRGGGWKLMIHGNGAPHGEQRV